MAEAKPTLHKSTAPPGSYAFAIPSVNRNRMDNLERKGVHISLNVFPTGKGEVMNVFLDPQDSARLYRALGQSIDAVLKHCNKDYADHIRREGGGI